MHCGWECIVKDGNTFLRQEMYQLECTIVLTISLRFGMHSNGCYCIVAAGNALSCRRNLMLLGNASSSPVMGCGMDWFWWLGMHRRS